MSTRSSELVDRMLAVLREDILPLTRRGVREGNKVFGAAILEKDSLALIEVGTNEETANPLFHGEISCLNRYWRLPRNGRPGPADCFFLSTHEPCPMCLAAIAWSGFDNFFYLFSYLDTRDEFEIPHDLDILTEIFECSDGTYRRANAYWTSTYLPDLIERGSPQEIARRQAAVADLRASYEALSIEYQRTKSTQGIPLP